MNGGGAINKSVFAGLVRGTLEAKAPHLLIENGGVIDPASDSLRQSFYRRHKLVKRRKTSSRTNLSQEQKEDRVATFCNEVNDKIHSNDILDALVINFDETSLPALPAQSYTMAIRGATNVRITGASDKRNVTGVVAGARDGQKIPWQIIYQGKTKQCHPNTDLLPGDFNVTHTKKHWSTNESKVAYLIHVIVAFINKRRAELQVAATETALVIFDMHRTNIRNDRFYQILRANHILWQLVPASMTDELQPMDQLVNKKIKSGMRAEFDRYYSSLVTTWINAGNEIDDFVFDDRWGTLKNRHCTWITNVYNSITEQDIIASFEKCGISSSLNEIEDDSDDNSDANQDSDLDSNHNH